MKKLTFKTVVLLGILACLIYACESDKNPCYDSVCSDNEYCLDGICIEIDQDEQRLRKMKNPPKPDQVKLSKLVITSLPLLKPSGATWDDSDGPDIHISVEQGALKIWETPNPIANVSQLPIVIQLDSAIAINDVEKLTVINFYDDDGNTYDEFVGGLFFRPFVPFSYPDTLAPNQGLPTSCRFDLTYVFD